MGRQRASQTVLTACYLHGLILYVVVWLGTHFLSFDILRVEVALCRVEVAAVAVSGAVLRCGLLVTLRRGVNDEVVLVLFGNG